MKSKSLVTFLELYLSRLCLVVIRSQNHPACLFSEALDTHL